MSARTQIQSNQEKDLKRCFPQLNAVRIGIYSNIIYCRLILIKGEELIIAFAILLKLVLSYCTSHLLQSLKLNFQLKKIHHSISPRHRQQRESDPDDPARLEKLEFTSMLIVIVIMKHEKHKSMYLERKTSHVNSLVWMMGVGASGYPRAPLWKSHPGNNNARAWVEKRVP